MKYWVIEFEKDGDKKVREYPQMNQWQTRKRLSEFLINRTFLTDYRVSQIVEFDPIKSGFMGLVGFRLAGDKSAKDLCV